jgi:tetratricopeptide (TPR) repeat protein
MPRIDRFDILLIGGLLLTLAGLGLLMLHGEAQQGSERGAALERALEKRLAAQARLAFLTDLYQPVEDLRKEGKNQQALLTLEEIARDYPGEAHGLILRGAILREMGVLERAVDSYVEAVQLNGDYVDDKSPLSRRTEIRQLVDDGVTRLRARLEAQGDNPSLLETLKKVYYLQSRLAGGCE